MDKPLEFIKENQGKLELNEEVLKIIENSYNPRLLLFYGATRQGKSTTLNQIIRGNIDTWTYINKEPLEDSARFTLKIILQHKGEFNTISIGKSFEEVEKERIIKKRRKQKREQIRLEQMKQMNNFKWAKRGVVGIRKIGYIAVNA